MLSIAYAASIGGMATLIGTPPNLIFAGIYQSMFNKEISFLEWASWGFPLAALMLFIVWFYLTRIIYHISDEEITGSMEVIKNEIVKQGRITKEERHVLIIFCLVAVLWMSRGLLWGKYVPLVTDASVAVMGALLLFIIPAGNGTRLLIWEDTVKVPWGVAILFGGGFAIANAFIETGLAEWVSSSLVFLSSTSIFLIILLVVTITKKY